MSQIQKLIWDHCYVSRTSTVTIAWLDRVAIKYSEALLPVGCLIYTYSAAIVSRTHTRHRIISDCIIYYASLQSQRWFLWHFYWLENTEGPWKLIWEHGNRENIRMTHWQLITILKPEMDPHLLPGCICPASPLAASPLLGGQREDHEVRRNQSGTHITLCLPPFSSPAGWQDLSGLTWVESDSNCHLHRQGSAAILEAQAKYT